MLRGLKTAHKPFLATIRWAARDSLVEEIKMRRDAPVLEVTKQNRGTLHVGSLRLIEDNSEGYEQAEFARVSLRLMRLVTVVTIQEASAGDARPRKQWRNGRRWLTLNGRKECCRLRWLSGSPAVATGKRSFLTL